MDAETVETVCLTVSSPVTETVETYLPSRLLLRAEAALRAECVFARVVRVVPIKESMGGLDRFT